MYVDAHVHIHDTFDVARLLRSTLARSRQGVRPLLLLLAEIEPDTEFSQRLDALKLALAGAGVPEPFELRATREVESRVLAQPHHESAVYLIAGRQFVSEEGLEVLGLAWQRPIGSPLRNGLPARFLLRGLLDEGAIAVLPWGVGKWIGTRGRRVHELISDPDLAKQTRFFVGDIAHRCRPVPRPKAFRAGVRVLAGTDVLALHGEEDRVGSYGTLIEAAFDPDRPAASLRAALDAHPQVAVFGTRSSALRVCIDQLRYRRLRTEPQTERNA